MPLTAERRKADVDERLQQLAEEIELLKQQILKMKDPFDTQRHRELHERLDNLVSEHVRLQMERRKEEGHT